MNAVKAIFAVILAALAVAIVTPFAVIAFRLSNTWTQENTGQLLGGGLAICGGSAAIVAVLVGAGLFARLAGWKPPRRDDDRPPVIDVTPPLPAPPSVPPWGLTGGGDYALLPPPKQDARFRMETEKEVREDR